jgi:MFS family permease
MSGSSMLFVTHIVPLAVDRGISAPIAAAFLSVYGIAAAFGTLLVGSLCDRIGALTTFGCASLLVLLPWTALGLLPASVSMYFLSSAMVGLCLGTMPTLIGACANELFGSSRVSRVMGLAYLIQVPFLFGAAPLAGYSFDATGSYARALITQGVLLAVAGVGFIHLRRRRLALRHSETRVLDST